MPVLPNVYAPSVTRDVTEIFSGYRRKLRNADGEFYDALNLTTAEYPLLSVRKPRGVIRTLTQPQGLKQRDSLAWVDGGTLWYNGAPTDLTGLSDGEKQLVSMGAYLLIFPDKKYINTSLLSDHGSMEASYTYTGSVMYELCSADGEVYPSPIVSPSEPASPANGELWLDTGGDTVLRQYSGSAGVWAEIPTVYTRISFTTQGQIPALFSRYDGVTVSGAGEDSLNGEKIIYALGGSEGGDADHIVVVGLITDPRTEENAHITIERRLPPLDYVCECQNRLWGCYYGSADGKNVNEIYCSALGDFRNWRQYMGLSTDSWAASVGSDGVWTGCVSFLGSPLFFKENRIHRVSVSSYGAHQLTETVCRGVQKGSSKSLCVVSETLFYKSPEGVCAYQGGFPAKVSDALGDEDYYDASAGSLGERYYISMRDRDEHWNLFCYDTALSLWQREDSLHVQQFDSGDGELYCIDADSGALLALGGSAGEKERDIPWMAESGILYCRYPDKKYLSHFTLRLSMEKGAELDVYIEYDSSGEFEYSGRIRLTGTASATVPIRPRRCDHLRLRLEGHGETRIFSLARILETGSDV